MSIIYSYPEAEPTINDLIIGTSVGEENATKTFTMGGLASLVGALASSGTVTSVQLQGGTFIGIGGVNPITTSGTITVDLDALGTPNNTTFLRGDNQWVTPTVSAGIGVDKNGLTLTDDVSRFNFTGTGVTVVADANGLATVSIDPAPSDITSINQGTGISVSSTTGDVIITNSGVTQITASGALTLTDAAGTPATTGALVLGIGELTSGTVTSVSPGVGLKLDSGDVNISPTIGINYSGNNNFIKVKESNSKTITTADEIVFNDLSDNNNIALTTIGAIPIAALPLVEADIDSKVLNIVKNNTDLLPEVAKVVNVISLLQSTYDGLATKAPNTLYLTTTDPAQETGSTVLAVNTNAIAGPAGGWSLSGDAVGATRSGTSGTPISSPYITTIALTSGYQWNGAPPTITNYTGNFPTAANSPETVTSTASAGTVELIPQASNTSTLITSFSNNFEPGIISSDFTTSFNAKSPIANVASGNQDATYVPSTVWTVDYSATNPDKYTLVKGSTVYTGNPIFNGGDIVAELIGSWTLRNYNATYVITDNIDGTGAGRGSKYNINISGSGWTSPYSGTAQVKSFGYGTTVGFGVSVTGIGSSTVSPSISYTTATSKVIGTNVSNNTFRVTITGTTGSSTGQFTFASLTDNVVGADGVQGSQFGYARGDTQWNGNTITVGQSASAAIGTPINLTQNGLEPDQFYTVVDNSPLQATFSPSSTFNVSSASNFSVTLSGQVIKDRFQIPLGPQSNPASVCGTSPGSSAGWVTKGTGSGSGVENGDFVFTSASNMTPVTAGSYKTTVAGQANSSIAIGAGGLVSNAVACLPSTFTIIEDNNIDGPSNAYTKQLQYKTGVGGSWSDINPGITYTGAAGDNIYTRYVLTPYPTTAVVTALTFSPSDTVALVLVQSQNVNRTIVLSGEVVVRVQSSFTNDFAPIADEACQNPLRNDPVYLQKAAGTSTTIQIGDICFTTATGSTVIFDGYYKANDNNRYIRIQNGNGEVTESAQCPPPSEG